MIREALSVVTVDSVQQLLYELAGACGINAPGDGPEMQVRTINALQGRSDPNSEASTEPTREVKE